MTGTAAEKAAYRLERIGRGEVCIHVWIDTDLRDQLEARRRYFGVPRSELVRRALRHYLKEAPYVAGSSGGGVRAGLRPRAGAPGPVHGIDGGRSE